MEGRVKGVWAGFQLHAALDNDAVLATCFYSSEASVYVEHDT